MELIPVSGNTLCLSGWQLIPLYMTDSHHCIMLDTGTENQREEIEATLAAAEITPIGLLCTHTHFDHFGNASYFAARYHCPVALPLGEAEVCRTASSVKSHMWVFSIGQVRHTANLAAIPCTVDHIIRPEESNTFFRGVRFGVLHTPGHSIDHVSYITPDGVCYVGDALLCGHSLHASKLPYAFDIRESLISMEQFRKLDCEKLIIAHKGIVSAPFDALVDENRDALVEALAGIGSLIQGQLSEEEIFTAVREAQGIQVNRPEKALDLKRFLVPYLECLIDDGTHRQSVRNGTLCYEPVTTQ